VRRYKPDILIVLALIFSLGLVVTTYSQELLSSHVNYSYSPVIDAMGNEDLVR
jgi:hypothetical protein